MKSLPVIACAMSSLAFGACSPKAKPPLESPDGTKLLITSIESDKKDPAVYGCVIVELQEKASTKVLLLKNTRVSAYHKWDVSWISNDEFKVTSSDVGDHSWSSQPDGTWRKDK